MFAQILEVMRALPPKERDRALDEMLSVMALLLEEYRQEASDPKTPSEVCPQFCHQCPFLAKN